MKGVLEAVQEGPVIADGAMGTMLMDRGLKQGECPELWNIHHPQVIKEIHQAYKEAGAVLVQTNTFGGNRIKLTQSGLAGQVQELTAAAVKLAKEVMGENGYVALSVGPTGQLFKPFGTLEFEDAYQIFYEQVAAGVAAGPDLIAIETMSDIQELRAALLAARQFSVPVSVSMTFETGGRSLMGTDPVTFAVTAESLGADIIGSNCSGGPAQLLDVAREIVRVSTKPVSIRPNAGLPKMVGSRVVYSETPEQFANFAPLFIEAGVGILGGCCGTTPQFISELGKKAEGMSLGFRESTAGSAITSFAITIFLSENRPVQVARVLHSGQLREQLAAGRTGEIAEQVKQLVGKGAQALFLDLEGWSPDEAVLLVDLVQSAVRVPLVFATDSNAVLTAALRIYKGKAGVMADNVKEETVSGVLAAAAGYGATVFTGRFREAAFRAGVAERNIAGNELLEIT